MSITRLQGVLLALVTVFYALQLLPHHFTQLRDRLGFGYFALCVWLGLIIVLGIAITLLMCILAAFDTELKKRRLSWLVAFLLMLVAAVGLTWSSVTYARGLPTGSFASRFDRQLWAHSSMYVAGDITPRQKMLGDVIHSIVVNGSRNDIVAALGPSHNKVNFHASGRDLIYCTGPERDSPFAIDSEWLLIWFDDGGRTARYEVWTD